MIKILDVDKFNDEGYVLTVNKTNTDLFMRIYIPKDIVDKNVFLENLNRSFDHLLK